jgi:Zinc carboxypeptidase
VPRMRLCLVLVLALLAVPLTIAGTAGAEIAPPWCGTPEPDAAENLPSTGPGNFPHIPYYAIGCTLNDIAARSDGRMTVEVVGQSATGRDMYQVVINALETRQQRTDFRNWMDIHGDALSDPKAAQKQIASFLRGGDFKIPLFIQGGIHGNEYEGVDASMQVIERLALTPYGTDAEVDTILDHAIVIFNPIQNPDGRVAGTRANGNGFDLNRDFMTQSQPETKNSITIMKRWFAPDMLDLHGYVTPTLIEATTKPHNPSIEYDMWLKWNQTRIDANEAAMNAIGQQVQRPINDWCSDPDEDIPPPGQPCSDGRLPGPAIAEGWDDWGPFYAPMYHQHVGLNSSTVEMCSGTSCGGRVGSRQAQYTVSWSTLLYDVANRHELYSDMITIYERGDTDARRPKCCPPPFDVANNWMRDYPQAYVIPRGAGQRSDAEANRLVEWLLFNDIEVHEITSDYSYHGQTFVAGSYVVFMAQPRRGLADTALSLGTDISAQISVLYAPPASWSHGYLWGADVVTIPDGARFRPGKDEVTKPAQLSGGLEQGSATHYALEIDSPTAVRTLNALLSDGVTAQLVLGSFPAGSGGTLAAGSAIFSAADSTAIDAAGKAHGVTFRRAGPLPATEPIDRSPRIAVFTNAVDQSVWSLRNLGFTANPVGTTLLNTSPTDPLTDYDVLFSTAGYPLDTPGNATARARLAAFFAAGGGYIGGGANGAAFLTGGGQVTGLTAANRGGNGRSGIVYWANTGGAASPITGVYPEQDTAIMDPPTWLTSIPSGWSADGRFPAVGFFASGLWAFDDPSATAPNSAVIARGTNTAGSSRMTVFAMNPLYRADPEREWPMLSSAAYWADQ